MNRTQAHAAIIAAIAGNWSRFHYHSNGFDGVCGLTIRADAQSASVVLTWLPENQGQSITNAMETITDAVFAAHIAPMGLTQHQMYLFEYHPNSMDSGPRVDMVTYTGRDAHGKLDGIEWTKLDYSTPQLLAA